MRPFTISARAENAEAALNEIIACIQDAALSHGVRLSIIDKVARAALEREEGT